jgi:cell division protein FtsB
MKLWAKRVVKYAQVAITIMVAVSVGVLISERGFTERQKLEEKKASLEKENVRLVGEIKSLEHKITLLRDDPKTIEKVAKRKLGMARPEETIYIFGNQAFRPSAGAKVESGLGTESNIP